MYWHVSKNFVFILTTVNIIIRLMCWHAQLKHYLLCPPTPVQPFVNINCLTSLILSNKALSA